jgi:hypothetical protein
VTEGARERDRAVGGVNHRAAAWLAWSLCWLTVAFVVCAVALAIIFDRTDAYYSTFRVDLVSCALVGGLIASRRTHNPVGWFFLTIAALLALQEFAREYATHALLPADPGSLPLAQAMAWLLSWIYAPAIALLLAFLPLYFPNGRLLSPRWRWLARSAVYVTATLVVFSALRPGEVREDWGIVNPLGIEALRPFLDLLEAVIGVALFAVLLASAASLVLRFRRSAGDERQQIKWLAYAASALTAWLVVSPAVWAVTPVLADVIEIVLFAGIPVAVGLAVLRYRLYDIDILINRTLVYGSLTAMLIVLYFGGVATIQVFLRVLTGQEEQPQLGVVVSTLVIAALFNPLRRRIQSFIDRSFYRRKYDARKTLEAFSAKLRDQTDLNALTDSLVGVVEETMQPAHVSVWLHPDPALKDKKKRAHIRESGREKE